MSNIIERFKKILQKKDFSDTRPSYRPSLDNTPKWKKRLKLAFWILFFSGLGLGLLLLGWIFYIASQAPEVSDIEASSFSQSSTIFDRTGEIELYSLHGEENREIVALGEISDAMQKAILAAEDWQFYEHEGVSIRGIVRAGLNAVRGRATGGSTISQQLVKMVVFAPKNETTKQKVERKIKEITVTRKLEKKYSKDRILELYLNKAPFGRNTYGIESAAQSYFGKSAKDLTIIESAVLAGLPQAPSRYQNHKYSYSTLGEDEMKNIEISSYEELINSSKYAKRFAKGIFGAEFEFANNVKVYYPGRFDFVLGQMKEKGLISEEEYLTAKEAAKTLEIKSAKTNIKAPHFEAYVEEEAHTILQDLYKEDYDEKMLNTAGLKIYTSLDYDLNVAVEKILAEQGPENYEYRVKNGAALVMNPKTGEILAMVGSRDFYGNYIHPETGETLTKTKEEMEQLLQELYPEITEEEQEEKMDALQFGGQVNVITSKRQPGSTFKPIVYASAFDQVGFSPSTVLMDVKTNFGNRYVPNNFDFKFHGPTSLRKALGNSYNIPAVKVATISGISNLLTFAQNMGITFDEDADFYGAPIALGSAEIKPLEMGVAYSSFANGGKKVSPVSILKIVSANGEIIYEYTPANDEEQEQIFEAETAYLITDILSDGSGEARPKEWNGNMTIKGHDIAAKTGTSTVKMPNGTTMAHDAWLIGYSPQITTVVWTGNNKGWKTNPTGALGKKATGFSRAGPIFKKIMVEAHKERERENFNRPSGIRNVEVSKLSGLLPPENFPEALIAKEVFNAAYLPEEEDNTFEIIPLVEESKLLPNEFTPEKAIKDFIFLNFHSYYPENKLWETPTQEWLEENREEFTTKLLEEIGEVPAEGEEGSESTLDVGNIILKIPEETTTKYTAETKANAPEITIVSPANMSIVAPPEINIEVEPHANNRILYVEFFWDDELISTKRQAPWTNTIKIEGAEVNTMHTITAKVTDTTLYSGENTVQVKIGEDTVPPEISFLFPQDKSTLDAGSFIQVAVDAIDRNSSIKTVQFFLDGEEIQTLQQMPFDFNWNTPEDEQTYSLKAIATDQSGNTAEDTVIFTIEKNEQEINQEGNLGITFPTSGSVQEQFSEVSFFVPEEMRTAENTISVNAKPKRGKRESIFEINGEKIPNSGQVQFSHSFPQTGEYEIYLRIKGAETTSSAKVNFTIE
jgi:membrane peptidoglycan carboxypeptidase